MKFWIWLMRAQEVALCVIRKWWRPITCIGIAGSIWVNGVIIPIHNWASPSLAELAALVSACAAAFAVREWGKMKGTVDDGSAGS